MKVLILTDEERNIEEVIEIKDAAYEYNLAPENDHESKENCGLTLVDRNDDWLFIPGVSKEDCNRICQELYKNDKADLRKYGKCMYM